jgi:hypothetical protein
MTKTFAVGKLSRRGAAIVLASSPDRRPKPARVLRRLVDKDRRTGS